MEYGWQIDSILAMGGQWRPMKKVRFNTSGAIALHANSGSSFTSKQHKPVKVDGWLIGGHICVQKPISSDGGWCVSLYPWGDRLTRDFYAKADAIAFADELHSLDIPWEHIRALDIGSDEYRTYIVLIMSLISDCDADGLLMPIEPNIEASPVKPRKSGKLPLLRH